MNIVRLDPFCEALFAPQRMTFRGGENVYTEEARGSRPLSPTIKSITYRKTANLPTGSLNLFGGHAIEQNEPETRLRRMTGSNRNEPVRRLEWLF